MVSSSAAANSTACLEILGQHPSSTSVFGTALCASDGETDSHVPHRALGEETGQRHALITSLRNMLVYHHVSPEALVRDRQRREAMERLGFTEPQSRMKRFPSNSQTQKGNLAEVILAEYLVEATGIEIPVYRFRYNPNIDQSMKGDDILAFDLDSDPVRILVGESKFRATSSKTAVVEIVEGLIKSHKGSLPISLQFVADRLFETGNEDLGNRVLECATLFALEKLRIDYVGMLLSDSRSADRLNQHTENSLRRLAVISLGIDTPDSLVAPCYDGLEETT